MKKVALLFLFLMLTAGLAFTDDPVRPGDCSNEKEQIIALQAELDIMKLELEALEYDLEIVTNNLEIAMLELEITYEELNKKDVEIIVLENKLSQCLDKPETSVKGVWIGVTSGYPFGFLGTFGYQLNDRTQLNSGLGYMGGFQIQFGLSRKIGNW